MNFRAKILRNSKSEPNPERNDAKSNSFELCENIIEKKNRENAMILSCFAVNHFDFTRKLSQFVTEEKPSKWRIFLNVNCKQSFAISGTIKDIAVQRLASESSSGARMQRVGHKPI